MVTASAKKVVNIVFPVAIAIKKSGNLSEGE
jgi:hypothetical protein